MKHMLALASTLFLLLSYAASAGAQAVVDAALIRRDRGLLDAAISKLAPERPARRDLYVVGFAGDSQEDVFRNEVRYLETLMAQRFGARDRIVTLINHRDSLIATPRPLATLDNLRAALAGVGRVMDRENDLLLLFLTMHGTPDHELYVQFHPAFQDLIDPQELRAALDDAGIRNRIVVISACYSGGFVPALRGPDTLILTAAHRNRPSFGCGADSEATYFSRAWLIDELNITTDFVAAFEQAKTRIAAREKAEGFRASRPQISAGDDILPRLRAWEAGLTPGPAVPYPYAPR